MGLFDDPLGTIGKGFATYATGGYNLLGDVFKGEEENAADQINKAVPPVDQHLKDIRDRQFNQAQKFRNDAPGLESQRKNLAADQARMDIAGDRSQITSAANSRGLLYSGLKQGAEAQSEAKRAASLANTNSKISQDIEDQQNQLDQRAMSSGLGVQEAEQSRLNNIYQRALNSRAAQASVRDAAGSITGRVVGAILGGA